MKAISYVIVFCTFFFSLLSSNTEAVSLKDSNAYDTIRSTVMQTIQPHERNFDVLIGGTDSFVDGLMNELENLPLDSITLQEIQWYLPNHLLRILSPKAYVSERLGRDVAVQFVRAVLQRKLCGPVILTPEQAAPVKKFLDQLWEKTRSILDQHDLGNNRDSIYRNMQILIGRNKRALEDPTFVSAAVDINPATMDSIIGTFREILHDITDIEVSNATLNEKYQPIFGPLGSINPEVDQSAKEFRLQVRLQEIPIIYALTLDYAIHNRSKQLANLKQFADTLKPLNKRIEVIEYEINQQEMAQFGQSKIIPENGALLETVNQTFLSNEGAQ